MSQHGTPTTREFALFEVERFLADSGMAPTRLGLEAVRDGKIVARLRRGENVTIDNVDALLTFIRNWRPVGAL